jgi:CrcB protein
MGTFSKYLAVAVGSALGGMARYFVANTWLGQFAAPFPAATFFINISGSFILGFFATLAAEKLNLSPHLQLAVAVGFLGAYTTFSTFEYETARLLAAREVARAALYVVLSVLVGFAAAQAGIALARMWAR